MSKPTAEELVRSVVDGVYALALRLTGNAQDAWDLTQQALLKALRGLPGFRGDSDPKTWVYRITVNEWKNRGQSKTAKWWTRLLSLDREPGEGGAPPTAGRDPSPDQELEKDEEKAALEAALAELPPEDRASLVLRELEGRSYRTIAEILGIPIGTVKSRLYRARAALARALEKRDAS